MNSERSIDEHRFNDDLLLSDEDRHLAKQKYPTILHVLDRKELRDLFSAYDVPANLAKSRSRMMGLLATSLVFTALVIAATEHLFGSEGIDSSAQVTNTWPSILAWVSASCGLVGTAIGGLGILFAGKKRQWLGQRLMTERIRQFHFQVMVFRLPEILDSLGNHDPKGSFDTVWKGWFDEFKQQFVGKLESRFTETIGEADETSVWLLTLPRAVYQRGDLAQLDPVFDAYRELRIQHQVEYANYKLRNDQRIFSGAPQRQASVLSAIGLVSIVTICAIHAGVLLDAIFTQSIFTVFGSGIIEVVVVWIALAGLSTRALDQGLQPDREVERYRQYRSSVRAIRDRFDRAASQTQKLLVMQDMERLSFSEMRDFLITNERARFVM